MNSLDTRVGPRLRRALLTAALAGFSGTAVAASYEQTQGEGYMVCEAFARHLKDRTEDNPMVCEAELDPRYNGFGHPEWEELSLEEPENLALFRMLDQAARARGTDSRSPANDNKYVRELTEEEWLRDFRWRRAQEHHCEPRLLKAQLGLDGEGEDETVLATSWGTEQCRHKLETKPENLAGYGPYALFIYDEATQRVDLELTDGPIGLATFKRFDPLIFQDRTFLLSSYHSSVAMESTVYLTTYGIYSGTGAAVSRCRFDMDLPRGREVTVLRHDLWGCSPESKSSLLGAKVPGLAVLDTTETGLDERYSRIHEGFGTHRDALIHHDRVYLTSWRGGRDLEYGRLAVYDTGWARGLFGAGRLVCEITYTPDNTQQ